MPWARLDDGINTDEKVLALSDAAHRMWTSGLAYCSRNLTDGFVPEHVIHTFGVRVPSKMKVADELCTPIAPGREPLWHKVPGGYQYHKYLDWNDSRDKVLAERAKAEARQQRFQNRKRFRVVNNVVNAVCNALHLPFETAGPTQRKPHSQQVSTYHNHGTYEKQERAERPSSPVENAIAREKDGLIRHLRRLRSRETGNGRPQVRVITALARDVLARHPDEHDDGELTEHLKRACARANLLYDATACDRALSRARAQRRKQPGVTA